MHRTVLADGPANIQAEFEASFNPRGITSVTLLDAPNAVLADNPFAGVR
jgi:hypothetical protein